MIPEKWKDSVGGFYPVVTDDYVKYMEDLCEKQAKAIKMVAYRGSRCWFCGNKIEYQGGMSGQWKNNCAPDCPVLASEEYLKGVRKTT